MGSSSLGLKGYYKTLTCYTCEVKILIQKTFAIFIMGALNLPSVSFRIQNKNTSMFLLLVLENKSH